MDFTWNDFVHIVCMIAVVVFIVGTLMLALYVIRLICTFNQLPIFDVESSARSETLRSGYDQSVRSRRSQSSVRSPAKMRRKRSMSKSRSSLRSGSLSRSEREEAPRWNRRGTKIRSQPIQSDRMRSEQIQSFESELESEGRTVNVIVRRKDIPIKTKKSSQESENVLKTQTRIQGVDIPRQTLKSGTLEEDEVVVPKPKGPRGIDIPRVTIRAGEADDQEAEVGSSKGRIKGIDIPKKTIRSGAGGEASKPNLTFNVEPGTSISVNVLSERAHAGGGEGECIPTSEISSGSDTIVCKTISSLTVTHI